MSGENYLEDLKVLSYYSECYLAPL